MRVNIKNYRQCFVPYTNNYIDVYIPWRNRAFNGDLVAVQLLDRHLTKVLTEDLELLLSEKGEGGSVTLPKSPSSSSQGNQNQGVLVIGVTGICFRIQYLYLFAFSCVCCD